MEIEGLAAQITVIRREISKAGSRAVSTPWGAFVWNARYPLVHDLSNCAWVDRWPPDFSVEELVADLEKHAHRAGLRHELLLFADVSLADRAQDELIQIGFSHESGLNLAHLGSPQRQPLKEVRVIETTSQKDERALWRVAAQELEESRPSPEEFRQQLAYDRLRYEKLSARLFLARVGTRAAGYAVLISHRELGYVFQVYTLPRYRRRGVATTVILHLLDASQEAGNRLTALTVNSSNEPALEMYRKLGFVEVGEKRNFERLNG